MTRDVFRGWLEKGLGRAVLFLKENDDLPYRDLIVHACTHNMAFDRQLESRSAAYEFDLICATKDLVYYRDRLLASLLAPLEEEDRDQIFQIAGLLAKSGDEGARLAMLAAFSQAGNEEIDGAEAIIRMDGFAGFQFIAQHRPETDVEDDAWLVGWWVEILEERYGEAGAWRELEHMETENSVIAAWLEIVRKDRADSLVKRNAPRSKRPPEPYAEMKRRLTESPRTYSVSISWYKNATEPDREQAAQDLLAQTDSDLLVGYLRLFRRNGFPLDPTYLIELTTHQDADLAHFALMTLGKTTHPEVRAFALDCLSASRHPQYLVGMLNANYEPGDSATVARLVKIVIEPSDYHLMEVDVKAWVEKRWDEYSVPILLDLYENGPCSYCREVSVKLLIEHDALPDGMRDEARYDADEDCRALFNDSK